MIFGKERTFIDEKCELAKDLTLRLTDMGIEWAQANRYEISLHIHTKVGNKIFEARGVTPEAAREELELQLTPLAHLFDPEVRNPEFGCATDTFSVVESKGPFEENASLKLELRADKMTIDDLSKALTTERDQHNRTKLDLKDLDEKLAVLRRSIRNLPYL